MKRIMETPHRILLFFVVFENLFCNLYAHPTPIVSRAEWGAAASKGITLLAGPVDYVFIHHTFIPKRCYTAADCKAAVLGVQKYHQQDRGWDDIGYSFLFGDDGKIYEGRGWDRAGAHTKGYNSVGLGFSFIGDFTNELPSPVMLNNLTWMINYGIQLGKIKSNYKVRGHRDMNAATECPGETFYQYVRKMPNY